MIHRKVHSAVRRPTVTMAAWVRATTAKLTVRLRWTGNREFSKSPKAAAKSPRRSHSLSLQPLQQVEEALSVAPPSEWNGHIGPGSNSDAEAVRPSQLECAAGAGALAGVYMLMVGVSPRPSASAG